jgi:pimeloyl-ACP methyl ester carboxylesterase
MWRDEHRYSVQGPTMDGSAVDEHNREVFEEMLDILPQGAASIEGLLAADHRADLAAVTIPVLLLHGADDAFWNMAGSRWVAERLANARLVELPACGHCPHIEAADAFNEELLRFLAADTSRAANRP